MENKFLKIERNKIVFVIPRIIVEAKNYVFVLTFFNGVCKEKKLIRELENKLTIRFEGFDTESKKIFEINSVRNYIQQLTHKFPYWYYFLSDESLWTIMLMLFKFKQTDSMRAEISRRDFHIVSTFLLRNLFKFYADHGLPESQIKPQRKRIEKYISKIKEMPYKHYLSEEDYPWEKEEITKASEIWPLESNL